MVTVISATNRVGNKTKFFAEKYLNILQSKGEEALLFSLEDLPEDFNFNHIYDYHHPSLFKIIKKFIIPAQKLIFVAPEYNGGIPGILKVFIDSIQPDLMNGKIAALAGVATGRSGNLRGIDHLTTIFHYLHMDVLPFKVPISKIHEVLDKEGNITDKPTLDTMEIQVERLLKFRG
jgi:chromate reductase, NAD(P)H dehydrogenase (quinone)